MKKGPDLLYHPSLPGSLHAHAVPAGFRLLKLKEQNSNYLLRPKVAWMRNISSMLKHKQSLADKDSHLQGYSSAITISGLLLTVIYVGRTYLVWRNGARIYIKSLSIGLRDEFKRGEKQEYANALRKNNWPALILLSLNCLSKAGCFWYFNRLPDIHKQRRVGRVVMQRIANPCTPVRFRYPPPTISLYFIYQIII